jgi:hypothetical protein
VNLRLTKSDAPRDAADPTDAPPETAGQDTGAVGGDEADQRPRHWRAGAQHVAREQLGRWLTAQDTDEPALLAMLLNQQYGQWRNARARDRKALRQRLGAARAQGRDSHVAELEHALTALEADQFTARIPSAYQLLEARRSLAGNRRWLALATGAAGGVLAWKDPLAAASAGAAFTAVGMRNGTAAADLDPPVHRAGIRPRRRRGARPATRRRQPPSTRRRDAGGRCRVGTAGGAG